MSHDGLFDGKDTHTSKTADHSAVFTAPEFNSKSRSANNNIYEVYAYAEDVKGNRSNTVKLIVKVVNFIDINEKTQANIMVSESPVAVNKEVTLKVTLTDSKGNPVTGKIVTINRTGDASSEISTVTEVSKGVYEMKTKSTTVGTDTFGFTVNNVPAAETVKIQYIKYINPLEV